MKKGRRNKGLGGGKPQDPSRRDFLAGMAAATGVLALGGCNGNGNLGVQGGIHGSASQLPKPEDSGIDYIVQVMMENRSFDHFYGWVPGADGRQAGVSFPRADGSLVQTFRLSQDPLYGFQGCGWADPDHGYDGGRIQLNKGAMNGWLLTGGTRDNPDDKFPIGYYTAEDLPFNKGVAENFTVCDNYFCGILSSTFPNRMYIHAGATDRLSNKLPYAQQSPSTLPTIWDRLTAKGISGRNYFFDLPTPGLWGTKYASIIAPFEQFLVDAAAGNLAQVTYIDPFFAVSVGESPVGISRDDHPQADVRDGQAFLAQIYNALRASPVWDRTLLVVTYDEWGGFYDHVVPPFAPVSAEEAALPNDGRLGFRVPVSIVGPRARRAHVSHLQLDPTSVLNFICWRFGLDGVGARANTSINLAHALDFESAPNLNAPDFAVPTSLLGFGAPCTDTVPLGVDPHNQELAQVLATIRGFGLPI